MKTCSRCHEDLPTSAFHKSRAQRDGLQSYCRSCNIKAATDGLNRSPHIRWKADYVKRMGAYGYENLTIREFTRDDLIEAYGDRCFHCRTGEFVELDHYPIPLVRGGAHRLENVVPACSICNSRSWREEVAA